MAERAYNNTCGETDCKLKQGFEIPLSPETHRHPLMHREAFIEINSLYEQRDCSVRGQMEKWQRERERDWGDKKETDRVTMAKRGRVE